MEYTVYLKTENFWLFSWLYFHTDNRYFIAFYHYKCPDEINTLVPLQAQIFTARTRQVTFTESDHPHFPRAPYVRRSFHSGIFLQVLQFCGKITATYQRSIDFYPPYSHNDPFHDLLSFISQTALVITILTLPSVTLEPCTGWILFSVF